MALAKAIYALPTWTRVVRLVGEHAGLQAVLGCGDGVPSDWVCYRFARKLREHRDTLARCIDAVTASLHARHSDMGRNVAIDGSDMPAYANGQRYVAKGGPERERFSDPDASWGHGSAVSTRKSGGFYKLDMAVCLPIIPGPRDARRQAGLAPQRWTRALPSEPSQARGDPTADPSGGGQ